MKSIFKFPTGVGVPESAIYLNTITQTKIRGVDDKYVDCFLVWHYFLVEDSK